MNNQKSKLQGIRYREHLEKWEARISINKQSLSRTFATLDEATAWRKSHEESKNSECHLTCGQIFQAWFESLKNDPDFSPQTLLKYQIDCKTHIEPFFKNKKVKDIDNKILLDFSLSLKQRRNKGKNISYKTITNVFGTLSNFFEFCCEHSYIELNPTKSEKFRENLNRFIRSKRKSKVMINIQSKSRGEDELKLLIAASYKKEPQYGFAVEFFLATGMRLGEVSAFTWGDLKHKVNNKSKEIYYYCVINKTRHHVDKKVQPNAKSGSNRMISIGKSIVERLAAWKRIAYEIGYETLESSPVFPLIAINQRAFSKNLGRLSIAVGIPNTTTHCLRHSYITYLAINGHNLQEVQKCAGHSSVNMTRSYFNSSSLGTESMAKTIDSLFIPIEELGQNFKISPDPLKCA